MRGIQARMYDGTASLLGGADERMVGPTDPYTSVRLEGGWDV